MVSINIFFSSKFLFAQEIIDYRHLICLLFIFMQISISNVKYVDCDHKSSFVFIPDRHAQSIIGTDDK